MPKINLLSKEVSELIAAGEVIERPASIVKELMENSIDAKATAVTVEIKNGGSRLIRVTDNGCGISREDLPTAFLRHATSKIQDKCDLESIMTLGFRGEALASVAAVSKIEINTKTPESKFGSVAKLEGGELVSVSDSGCPDGTTIFVRDLFYNVPARQKFLKKDITEANAAELVAEKTALSHPEISFKFIRDGKTQLNTPGNGNLLSVIFSVFGKEFAESMLPVEYEYNGLKVSGYVSDPVSCRKSRQFQNMFVNGRYVKSNICAAALEDAYKNSIMIGKFPACVLRIDITASKIDVNVHPAKTEIRFTNENEVYNGVYFAVKNALQARSSVNEIAVKEQERKQEVLKAASANIFKEKTGEQTAFSSRIISEQDDKNFTNNEKLAAENKAPERIISENKQNFIGFGKSESKISDELKFEDNSLPEYKSDDKENYNYIKIPNSSPVPNAVHTEITSQKAYETDSYATEYYKIIGELFKTYILVEYDDAFALIDKHAAHERIIFERLKASDKDNSSQMLLTPKTVSLPKSHYAAAIQNLNVFADLGFSVEDFGSASLIVRAVPMVLSGYDAAEFIEEIAQNIANLKNEATPQIIEELYHSMACKAAVRAHDENNILELEEIVKTVFENDNIRYCPHGRPVLITMTKNEIERRFGRQG